MDATWTSQEERREMSVKDYYNGKYVGNRWPILFLLTKCVDEIFNDCISYNRKQWRDTSNTVLIM